MKTVAVASVQKLALAALCLFGSTSIASARKWADWRYVPMLKGTEDHSNSPVYTRFLTTSYKGQLLEITFTSNLNTSPELKKEIDRIMDSVHLQE
jgi:hypothetical protein